MWILSFCFQLIVQKYYRKENCKEIKIKQNSKCAQVGYAVAIGENRLTLSLSLSLSPPLSLSLILRSFTSSSLPTALCLDCFVVPPIPSLPLCVRDRYRYKETLNTYHLPAVKGNLLVGPTSVWVHLWWLFKLTVLSLANWLKIFVHSDI